MKKILLTVVLGIAVGAVAQGTAQPQGQSSTAPAQGQSAAAPAQGQAAAPAQSTASQAPVIKDPAEYNAYVAAMGATDPKAKISGLEAFLTAYPNSVMKNQALELLMGAYQQTNDAKKTMDAATRLVTSDPCNLRALTLLAFFDRALAQNNDPNAAQLLTDGKKYGQAGLDCLPKATDPEILKNKATMEGAFHSAIGIKCLQDKDYACATKELKSAVESTPDTQKDFSLVWPLALAYLQQPTPDYQNGIWYGARATALAPPQGKAGVEKYVRGQYIKFHAGDDGWTDVLGAATSGAAQVPIKAAPTPAEQCHAMVGSKKPEDMNFAEWQFAFTNCAQEDQDLVWNAIKGKSVQMNGTIISTTPTEFQIAGSSDDIDAKKADITLKFEDKVPVKLIPKDGASFDFSGEPASYTPNPFMMIFEKGKILTKAAPPAKKPAAGTAAHKKPAAQ